MRRSPIPSTVFAWVLLKPIVLLRSVTFSVFALLFAMALRSDELRLFLAAHPGDERRIFEAHQTGKRRPDHVVRVGGPERFRHHVLDADALHHGANRAAGDEARPFRCGLQEDATRSE